MGVWEKTDVGYCGKVWEILRQSRAFHRRGGIKGGLTVSRPRLMVPTNLEMATVRDMMTLARPVKAIRVVVMVVWHREK